MKVIVQYIFEQMSEENKEVEDAFNNFADSLVDVEEKDKQAKKEILREGIAEREEEYNDQLKQSKLINQRLGDIRERADMSPFVGTSGEIKSPRFRRDKFIKKLARELLYIGRHQLNDHGGLLSMDRLHRFFKNERENWQLRDKDIPEAIEWLEKNDLIPGRVNLEDKTLIQFKALELGDDTRELLQVAHGMEPSKEDLRRMLGWEQERVELVIQELVDNGIAIDDGQQVYFPGL